MNEIAKALEALDRIFNYCEEIDLHLPKEEQTGYDMLVDINIIREALVNQKSIVEELEKIKAEFEEDKYILLNQTTAIKVIDKHIAGLKGEQK